MKLQRLLLLVLLLLRLALGLVVVLLLLAGLLLGLHLGWRCDSCRDGVDEMRWKHPWRMPCGPPSQLRAMRSSKVHL